MFGSLMADRVEARQGPGLDTPVAVVFNRAGLPVAVVEQAKEWVRIQDSDGAGGWVQTGLVSKRRTALVLASRGPESAVALRSGDIIGAGVTAYLEPGVIVGVISCDGRVCRITTAGVRGMVDQSQLWGVAEGETVR